MANPLKTILNQLSELAVTDEYDYLTFEYLWQWVVFHNNNTELNDTMDIHAPSGFAVGERKYGFREDLKIKGEFLLFEIIDHAPAYEIRTYDSKMDMLDKMVALFFNGFASLTIPIVAGKALGVKEMFEVRQKYFGSDVAWDFDSYKMEEILMMKVHEILRRYLDNNDSQLFIDSGLDIFHNCENKNISRQSAYKVIGHLSMMYALLGFNIQEGFKQLLNSLNNMDRF